MKKTIKIASLAILMGALITGCSDEEEVKKEELKNLVCNNTINNEEQGYQSTITNTVTYNDNNEVTKIESFEVISSDDTELLNTFQSSAIETYQELVENYGGYEILTSQKETELEITTTIDYNVFDLEQYTKDEEALKEYVNENNKLTVESVTKMYESTGGTCK